MAHNRDEMPSHLMSALGQKQTFAVQNVMSALPPKADIRGRVLSSALAMKNPWHRAGVYHLYLPYVQKR